MAVKYRLEFDTTAGADIRWQLDILQQGYVGDDILPLVGTSNPVTIKYQEDNDIYKPITGSTATINLLVTNDVTYDDFNTGSIREYEVRLRYEDNSPTTIQETLTATGQANVGTTRTNIFLNQQDRQRFFEIFLPGVTYTETDNDIATTRAGTLNGVALPLGTNIRNNSSRTSVRGNFNFGTGGLGTTFIIAAEDTSTVLRDYWCGFINPIDSRESVKTNPFTVSFTATDGLGLLEQLPINRAAADDSGLLFGYIHRALKQTGLELDILVDSKIMTTTGSAILSVLSSPDAFKPEEGGTEGTLKESLEGVLETFNYKVFQSGARWYVVNCSTHGGTGDTETITWNTFNADGEPIANITEDLRYSVVSGGDLIPANSDLVRNFRRPIGSVEARPSNLTQITAIDNFDFSQEGAGWNANGNIDTTLLFNETTFLTGNRSIATNRSRYNADTDGTIWFRSEGALVESSLPTTLEIDWRILDGTNNGSYKNPRFFYRVYVDLGAPLTVFDVDGIPRQISRMYYEHDGGFWYVRPTDTFARLQQSGDDWENTSVELAPVMTTDNRIEVETGVSIDATIFVEFTYGAADTTGTWEFGARESDSTSLIQVLVDRVQLSNQIEDDFSNPVYEYVQPNHARTIDYNPKFISQGLSTFREILSESDYWREGETVADAGLLEQLITLQKLNDFQDRFTYYEGTLINNSSIPLSQVHKPLVQLTPTFTELSSCILNGGTFSPKKNEYKVNMYVPNQITDVVGEFFTMNVDLILPPFEGGNRKASYVFEVDLAITDGMGVVAPEDTITVTEPFVSLTGSPGDIVTHTLNFVASTGNIAVANTFALRAATEATPIPNFITLGEFYQSSARNISVDLQITLPDRAEFERIYLDGMFQEFDAETTPGVVAGSLLITNSIPNTTPASFTIPLDGVPGDDKYFTVSVQATIDGDGNPLFNLFNLDETSDDDDLTFISAAGGGSPTGVFNYRYRVPTTGELDLVATLTGSSIGVTVDARDIRTRDVLVTNTNANATIVDGSTTGNVTTIQYIGEVGTHVTRNITSLPIVGMEIASLTTGTLPAGLTIDGEIHRSGEDYEVPMRVDFIGDQVSADLPVTFNIATSVEPFSVTFNLNNVNANNSNLFIVGSSTPLINRQTYSQNDLTDGDNIVAFIVALLPDPGQMWASVDDADLDVAEGAVATANGNVISLAESAFTAAKATSLASDGSIRWTIAGALTSPGGNYIVGINTVGPGSSGSAIPVGAPATLANPDNTLVHLGPALQAQGSSTEFLLTIDGAWTARLDVRFGNVEDSDNSNGMFSRSYTVNGMTGTLSGSYSLTSGGAGEHSIIVTTGPLFYEVEIRDGNSNLFPSDNVRYELRIFSGTTLVASASATQSASNGARTITYPGATVVQLMQAGQAFPTWTFQS